MAPALEVPAVLAVVCPRAATTDAGETGLVAFTAQRPRLSRARLCRARKYTSSPSPGRRAAGWPHRTARPPFHEFVVPCRQVSSGSAFSPGPPNGMESAHPVRRSPSPERLHAGPAKMPVLAPDTPTSRARRSRARPSAVRLVAPLANARLAYYLQHGPWPVSARALYEAAVDWPDRTTLPAPSLQTTALVPAGSQRHPGCLVGRAGPRTSR